jgi:hypothetical protein
MYRNHSRSRSPFPRARLAGVRRAWLAAAAVLLLPGGLQAQTIYGELLDASNLRPVAGALIQILDEEGEAVAAATADPEGRYDVSLPGPGLYRIVVSHLGYGAAGSDLIAFEAEDSLQANLLLPPAPIALEGIEVDVEARPWMVEHPPALWPYFERREFYGRRLGLGQFVDQEFLENWAGELGTLPQIQQALRSMELRSGFVNEGCSEPAWFLNGMRLRGGDITDFVTPRDLAGIEIYRRATEIPAEFAGSDSECGVIAVWTRR